VIDPNARWSEADGRPDYAGLPTFGGLPYTEDPAELAGVDAAIIGAPIDELASDRPGTRQGPRAIRAASAGEGADLETGIDPYAALRVIDFGDAAVRPADPRASHAEIERTVGQVVAAGAIPVVLGGDHSITEPNVRACATVHGPLGLVHFDTHTDTAELLYETRLSHGTPMYHLVEDGHVDPAGYVQIGLRGHWPGAAEFEWQRRRGITSVFMHEIRDRGIAAAVERAVEVVGDRPAFLTVDVDVLDPAFAPGTGTPEPGGINATDLLWACRTLASRVTFVGIDVVEVLPSAIGTADITALVADRVVRQALIGVALRRGTRAAPEAGPPAT
jgi:agmatinase